MDLKIPNYEIVEKIAQSPQASIYKAYHKKNPDRRLVLKVLKTTFLSDYKKSHFQQKVEQLRILKDPLLIVPRTFEGIGGLFFFTQDYFEGVSLDKIIEARSPLDLKTFFTLACSLTRAVDKVHEAGIIHGGIKPHNILVNPETLEMRLIDFLSTFDVRDVSHFIYDPSFIKDTLAYTSPEQTGRINHRVVFSSDMYSLGIVFYELLTGRIPFTSEDPLEVIHSHLAQEAPQVSQVRPDIPLVLSKIIARLMLKEPEKRYQSSNGLLVDLLRCRDEYLATGTIQDFPLESRVYTHRVTFISRMVGRDEEARTVLEEYEKVTQGSFRALFISGLSGIGKTRLIQELQKPIVKHRGYFTSGKFDVYQKNIPYSSLIQALRNLMRTFLTESNERVAGWKQSILQAVGQNGRVLTDVVPELEVLLGPQPEVTPLPPVESLNRFHDVFGKFLSCLASRENPLTIFIDDLQWCDTASFDFFTNIFANYQDHPYLFFLGAYRHNEVDSSHPLTRLIHTVNNANQPLKEIRLGALKPEHCHEMVAYILDSPLSQTRALADFISDLSEGNPLFVSESLSYLHNEDLLYLDRNRQWRWDMEKIRHTRMPTSVVALFSSKIQKLPAETIRMLEYCACMGNSFSPAEVALIREMSLPDSFEVLKPALGQGLLIENKNQLQFIHDKVQEASLSAISTEKRRQIHWQVGNHLLSAIPSGADLEKLDNLFTIVSHLNLGRDQNPDKETAYLLSSLNYHAGNKALDSLAAVSANEYFNLSCELLPEDCWEDKHYEQAFRVYQKTAKTELMCGNYEKSERLLSLLLEHARTDLDKAECLAEQTTSLSSIGNFIKAIETANRGLAYFNKAIPDQPEEAEKRRKELAEDINSRQIDVWETILNMPFTNDRKSKIELKFYSELIPDLYMSGLVPQLYLSAAQSTRHCLEGGMDESVIYSFSIMGLQLGEQGEFEKAFKYEDLARNLSARYPNTFGATRGMNGIVWFNAHSRSHPREIVDYCLKSIQCGKNCGDLYNAGLSYGPLMWNLQVQGEDLAEIEEYARECLQFSQRYHLSFSVGLAEAMRAGWIDPMKKGAAPTLTEEKLRQWEKDNHVASAGSYFVHRGLAHYYLGEYEKAQQCLDSVRRYLTGLTDNVLKRQWHVFLALNALKLYEKGLRFQSPEELKAEIRPLLQKVETWAGLGPLLKPYLAFLYAEIERVTGDFKAARSLYLDAINTAHEQHYTFLEGHLNECLGEFLRQAGYSTEKIYFKEAARLYQECRAGRKEFYLLEQYQEYFTESRITPAPISGDLSSSILPDLDMEYLMKSSLAISAEIEEDALLKKIMDVVIESSAAQNGYLLIEDKGNLFVRAESHISSNQGVQTLNRILEDTASICKAIVRYVHRTGEKILLNDALQDCTLKGGYECTECPLKDDIERTDRQNHAILCFPVIKQSRMMGILYLENHLSGLVFTPEKTQMLELLSSQIAVSLENARLVEELRETRDYLNNLIDYANAPIIVWDSDFRVTRFNHAFERLTGRRSADVLGKNLDILFPESSRTESMDYIYKAVAGERWEAVEIPILHLDGSIRTVLWNSATLYDSDGQTVIATIAQGQDITARKQAEEMLRQRTSQLEAANKELEAFSYSVSHDLRAPLRSMEGFSQALLEDYEAVLDNTGKDFLRRIQDSSFLMAQLIDDLLKLSRINRSEMQREQVDLTALARDIAAELQKMEPQRQVEFDAEPNLIVWGDSRLLRTVLENLLGNAWKFTGKTAEPWVKLGVTERNGAKTYFVKDNGVGFDMKYSKKLFTPFQRLHKPTEFPGTGIGLASVHRIIRRHGGEVWAEGAVGKGAAFYFTLGE